MGGGWSRRPADRNRARRPAARRLVGFR